MKVRGTVNLPDVPSGYFYRDDGTFAKTVVSLFDRYTDETTSGLLQENLYTYTLPTGFLAENGDKIQFEFSGILTANTNFKRLYPIFAGTVLATGQTNVAAATDWTIDGYIIRVSNSIVRFAVEFTTTGDYPIIESGEISGLNLTTTDYQLDLDGRSPSAAGELTVHSGFATFYPAA
jgi:hypothetical protein